MRVMSAVCIGSNVPARRWSALDGFQRLFWGWVQEAGHP